MKFSTALISATALAASSVHAQAISAEKTVSNIKMVTSMSSDLDTTAKKVTLVNGFQTGPEVIKGFHDIVKTAAKAYHEMQGGDSKRSNEEVEAPIYIGSHASKAAAEVRASTSYTTKEQEAVCTAFIDFVKVHQALLATVIGKHGILEVTGVAYQMAAVLRGVEGVVDEIAFTLIEEVPTCASKAKAQKEMLDKSLQNSIDTYANGLP